MKTQSIQLVIALSACIAAAGLSAGCASKGQDVSLAQLPEAARATVAKVTAGGQVDKITREVERGKVVYDVEATLSGKHMEYLIADANGEVLGTEVPVSLDELPEPVRAAAEKYFGTSIGLTAMKGVEYGETQYEIEGPKNGKTVEVTFSATGKQLK